MGNSLKCLHPQHKQNQSSFSKSKSKSPTKPIQSSSSSSTLSRLTSRITRNQSTTTTTSIDIQKLEDSEIREQAIAAALLYQLHQKNGSLPPSFNRSTSVVYPSDRDFKKKPNSLLRSSSSRPFPTSTDFALPIKPNLIPNQDIKIDGLVKQHFVLVHGGGFGAWCWYKTIALLQEGGFDVDAVDLTGSGIHSFETNNITSLAQYVKPLTDFLERLEEGKKVILVGHDFGGACVSYAMELFPSKIAKAIFVAAMMPISGQSTLDMFSPQMGSNDLMQRSQKFVYGNGKNYPPTAIDLDKALLRDLLFNECSSKDVALASVSIRPIPFAPVLEKLSLSDVHYGSVRRFYIETQEDCAMPMALQETMINSNPPEKVFYLKGSDHSPFFSKPQSLHKFLVEIANHINLCYSRESIVNNYCHCNI